MVYKILETDKRKVTTILLAKFDNQEAAYKKWREIAWQHVDDAYLWHRLASEDGFHHYRAA